jgi:hypothetical protein
MQIRFLKSNRTISHVSSSNEDANAIINNIVPQIFSTYVKSVKKNLTIL